MVCHLYFASSNRIYHSSSLFAKVPQSYLRTWSFPLNIMPRFWRRLNVRWKFCQYDSVGRRNPKDWAETSSHWSRKCSPLLLCRTDHDPHEKHLGRVCILLHVSKSPSIFAKLQLNHRFVKLLEMRCARPAQFISLIAVSIFIVTLFAHFGGESSLSQFPGWIPTVADVSNGISSTVGGSGVKALMAKSESLWMKTVLQRHEVREQFGDMGLWVHSDKYFAFVVAIDTNLQLPGPR